MTMLRNEAPTRLLPLGLVLLAACGGGGESPRPDFASDVDECHHNLREIYNGMRAMKAESGWQPTHGGVGFFGELISSGFWPDTPENRAKLSCPGKNVPAAEPLSFADLDALTGAHSAYAGRDLAAFPLERFPTRGTEPLISCDNAHGMNHDGVMNVLFADGSIKTFQLQQEIAEGRLVEGSTVIPVGANSTVDDLRMLTSD
ncbi:MAG: H-X9-DG-CTERM domain-containing protein [Planctomycetota bacterium]